jgi:hypothetical protein
MVRVLSTHFSLELTTLFLFRQFFSLLLDRCPSVTIARLTLESYFRSGWMWAEFVLVLVFFAAVYSIGLALIAGFWLERRELLLY